MHFSVYRICLLFGCMVSSMAPMQPCSAQFFNYGALHSGLADASLAFPSTVAGPNPAMQDVAGVQLLSVYTARPYSIKDLTHSGVSATLPVGRFVLNTHVSGMQVEQYRQVRSETSASYPFGAGTSRKIYAGIRLTTQHVAIDTYGSTSNFALSAGFVVPVWHNILLGASALNVLQSTRQLYLPQMLGVGFAAKLQSRFWLMAAVYHEPEFLPALHTGLQISIQHMLQLRYGITTNPFRWTGGFGLQLPFIELHVAMERHVLLGWTPEVSINLVRMRQKDL